MAGIGARLCAKLLIGVSQLYGINVYNFGRDSFCHCEIFEHFQMCLNKTYKIHVTSISKIQ